MSTLDQAGVVEVYTAYLEDVNQLRATRTAIDNTYVTVVAIFLGGAAYIASSFLLPPRVGDLANASLETWVPILAVMAIGSVGAIFCRTWHQLIEDNRKSISFKFKNLEKMERQFPELQRVGAQLFMEEYYDRHPEKRPLPAAPASSAVQPLPTVEETRDKRGASARTLALQQLFGRVFAILVFGTPLVKGLAILGVSMTPLWSHVTVCCAR